MRILIAVLFFVSASTCTAQFAKGDIRLKDCYAKSSITSYRDSFTVQFHIPDVLPKEKFVKVFLCNTNSKKECSYVKVLPVSKTEDVIEYSIYASGMGGGVYRAEYHYSNEDTATILRVVSTKPDNYLDLTFKP